MLGVPQSEGLKLFGPAVIFEVFQPVSKTYLNVTDRQTDRQTTYDLITALCVASRGKNNQLAQPYFGHLWLVFNGACALRKSKVVISGETVMDQFKFFAGKLGFPSTINRAVAVSWSILPSR